MLTIHLEAWQESDGAVTQWTVDENGRTVRRFDTLEEAERFVCFRQADQPYTKPRRA